MKPLLIDSKLNSPAVNFNAETGRLEVIGRSIPEHPVKFYQPLEDWLTDFIQTNPNNIILHVFLDYLNTHSTECMLLIMKQIKSYVVTNSSATVKVEWLFDEDDEDMEALGQDLESITKLSFEYKVVTDD